MLQLSVLWSPVCLLRMSRSTGVLFERKESIYFCYMEDYILHNENKDEAPSSHPATPFTCCCSACAPNATSQICSILETWHGCIDCYWNFLLFLSFQGFHNVYPISVAIVLLLFPISFPMFLFHQASKSFLACSVATVDMFTQRSPHAHLLGKTAG